MEPTNWAPEHSDVLQRSLAKRMSFSEIVKTINARFNTAYTRSAAIGRARRMAQAIDRPETPVTIGPRRMDRQGELRAADLKSIERRSKTLARVKPEMPKLRCVEVDPHHLSLVELERSNCRYPYGGDAEGEAITFCGRPRRAGSSYCTPHFNLSRNPVVPEDVSRAASRRLYEDFKSVTKEYASDAEDQT